MPNDAKFKELILYIAQQSERDVNFGKTKLNKLMFFADFRAYYRLGQSISGQIYSRQRFGPVPSRMELVVETMRKAGECAWAKRDYGDYQQLQLKALREPDLSVFTGAELAIVNRVLSQFKGMSATDVSALSHEFPGYQAMEMNEEIPYNTVFVGSPRALTEQEIAYGQNLARNIGAAT
jgi:uncharacterized phage-associated protein